MVSHAYFKGVDKNNVPYLQLTEPKTRHIQFLNRRIHGKFGYLMKSISTDMKEKRPSIDVTKFFSYRKYQKAHGVYKRLRTVYHKEG